MLGEFHQSPVKFRALCLLVSRQSSNGPHAQTWEKPWVPVKESERKNTLHCVPFPRSHQGIKKILGWDVLWWLLSPWVGKERKTEGKREGRKGGKMKPYALTEYWKCKSPAVLLEHCNFPKRMQLNTRGFWSYLQLGWDWTVAQQTVPTTRPSKSKRHDGRSTHFFTDSLWLVAVSACLMVLSKLT